MLNQNTFATLVKTLGTDNTTFSFFPDKDIFFF